MFLLTPRKSGFLCSTLACCLILLDPSPTSSLTVSPTSSLTNTFTVTTTIDGGPGSLRQAILDANSAPGKDTIDFKIGSGSQTIRPRSPLPTITDPVIIDGTTQPGFLFSPIIELEGTLSGGYDGLKITAGDSLVQGLVINRFYDVGIRLLTGGNNTIRGNYIGTDLSGTIALGNGYGLHFENSSHNTIGGTDTLGRNVISGNRGIGVNIYRGELNQVLGNYIGINASGTGALGNGFQGLGITGGLNDIVGGPTTESRNVISGNKQGGISISGSGNNVQGNYIGTNADGTSAVGNSGDGVFMSEATNTTIGGATPGAGNLISGNGGGVKITLGTGNRIQGNYIGTDRSGTSAISNPGGGVVIISAANTLIGGTTVGARNVISGNGLRGIVIDDSFGATGNQVQGNYIGTQADGISPLGNASHGVMFQNLARGNTIGGPNDAGNVIAYNGGAGVTGQFGESPQGGNPISANSIHSNSGLGIDWYADGVSPNEDGDYGNNGVQNFPVLTATRVNGGGTTILGTLNSRASISFRIEFFSNSSCDSSGNGEGARYVGATMATTDNGGNLSFNVVLPFTDTAGSFISATATNAANYTSEFSKCAQALEAPPPVLLKEANSNRGIALDSVTFVRDPLPITTYNNFSSDRRTRVSLFAINVEPGPTENSLTVQAEDSQGIHPLTIEYVGKVPNFDWLTVIVVKLPDEISLSGDVSVSITYLGAASNKVLIGIKAP